MTPVTIRPSEPSDIPAITAIYAHHVRHGTASFEEEAPGEPEMAERRAGVLNGGFPYIVAEREGVVVGYAYLSKYRPRSAYRFTVENSIYIAHDAIRQGIGRALMAELLRIAEAGSLEADDGGDQRPGFGLGGDARGFRLPQGRPVGEDRLQVRQVDRRDCHAAGHRMTGPNGLEQHAGPLE